MARETRSSSLGRMGKWTEASLDFLLTAEEELLKVQLRLYYSRELRKDDSSTGDDTGV
jgi:hypothetical protein